MPVLPQVHVVLDGTDSMDVWCGYSRTTHPYCLYRPTPRVLGAVALLQVVQLHACMPVQQHHCCLDAYSI